MKATGFTRRWLHVEYTDLLPLYHVMRDYRRCVCTIENSKRDFALENFSLDNFAIPFYRRERTEHAEATLDKLSKDLENKLEQSEDSRETWEDVGSD